MAHPSAFALHSSEEWNWPISCLNNLETRERGLQGVKIQKCPCDASPPPPPPPPEEACTFFGFSLANRSVFVLHPRLSLFNLIRSVSHE